MRVGERFNKLSLQVDDKIGVFNIMILLLLHYICRFMHLFNKPVTTPHCT
jgi:hypothetical protein